MNKDFMIKLKELADQYVTDYAQLDFAGLSE